MEYIWTAWTEQIPQSSPVWLSVCVCVCVHIRYENKPALTRYPTTAAPATVPEIYWPFQKMLLYHQASLVN